MQVIDRGSELPYLVDGLALMVLFYSDWPVKLVNSKQFSLFPIIHTVTRQGR